MVILALCIWSTIVHLIAFGIAVCKIKSHLDGCLTLMVVVPFIVVPIATIWILYSLIPT